MLSLYIHRGEDTPGRKIDLTEILIVLFSIPFFTPEGLTYTNLSFILSMFRNAQKVVCLFIILLYCLQILQQRRISIKRFDLMTICVVVLCAVQWITTKLNSGDMATAILRCCILLASYVVVADLVRRKPKAGIRTLYLLFLAVFIINLIALLALYSSHGFRSAGDYWLFGQKNAMRNIIFPTILLAFLNDRVNRNKIITFSTILISGLSLLSLILVESTTSVVLCLMILGLNFWQIFFKNMILDLKKTIVIFLFVSITVVLVRNFTFVSYFVTVFLGKDLTFTSRIYIWDSALKGILKSPLWGTGIQILERTGLNVGKYFFASHAHNALLDVFYKNGIFGFLSTCVMYVLSCVNVIRLKKNPIAILLGTVLGAFLLAGIVGELWSYGFYIVLFLAYILPKTEVISGLHLDVGKFEKKGLRYLETNGLWRSE